MKRRKGFQYTHYLNNNLWEKNVISCKALINTEQAIVSHEISKFRTVWRIQKPLEIHKSSVSHTRDGLKRERLKRANSLHNSAGFKIKMKKWESLILSNSESHLMHWNRLR